jgi:GNAT superfamily N-acetyltransferase
MTIRIRVAELTDAAALAELATRLFSETFGADNSVDDMREYLASAFSPQVQAAELAERARVVWIVENDRGAAVGYAMLLRDSTGVGVSGQRPAEVERIYVDRSLHGQGAGAMLLNTCIEQARGWGCDVIWLAVWERNPRAIAFYQKSGFAKVGEKDFQLGSDTQHDHVMARPLH